MRSPRSRLPWASARVGTFGPWTVVATGIVTVVGLVVLVAGQLGLGTGTGAEALRADASATGGLSLWRMTDAHWLNPYLTSAGWLSPVLFVVVFVFMTMLGVPRAVLTVAAGWAFGAWVGAALAWAAGMGAAWAGYELARAVASSRRAATPMPGRARAGEEACSAGPVGPATRLWRATATRLTDQAEAMDNSTKVRAGVFGVASARLVPVVPFALVNYGCGAAMVMRRSFLLGSGLGLIPGAAGYAAIGAGLSWPGWLPSVTVTTGVVVGVVGLSAAFASVRRRTMHRRPCARQPSCPTCQAANTDDGAQ